MATLVFSALGRALAGRAGAVIGAVVGRQIDGAIFAPTAREGARLSDLAVTTSSYGEPVPRHFGRMRVGGTIIWATDLSETRQTRGGGKGRPAQTSYSYSASFAVALASNPLAGVGRIWADGVLLRGAAGDLKIGGQFRFHSGHGDQQPDPLIAAAEGLDTCPAYRGIAYAVFEDLQLGEFGNRIPTLSFEVLGEQAAFDLATVIGDPTGAIDAAVPLEGVAGLSVAGPLADTLDQLAALVPIACDVTADRLILSGEPALALPLPEAAAPEEPTNRHLAQADSPPGALRYYDLERDYQIGVQRSPGAPAPGQPRTLDLPLALTPTAARQLIEAATRRADWSRQSLTWRTAAIDPRIGPGAIVRVPDRAGLWRVSDWEWQGGGLELTLWRTPAAGAVPAALPADPGRAATAGDRMNGPTVLLAFELPWDGTAARPAEAIYVAAGSVAAGWSGAALYADDGSGSLQAAGASGRTRAVIGQALESLADASSLLPDRASRVVIALLADDMDLIDATGPQLANGANRALLGGEIVQFARAEPLGQARWRLSGLLRGRGGTEAMTGLHAVGESFVLLDDRLTVLDSPPALGAARIAAIGLADAEPVGTEVAARGIGRRPLSPVHPTARRQADGALTLGWTRRARGSWGWTDGAEVPLHEESESYEVLIGDEGAPLALWAVSEPRLTIAAATVQSLRAASPGAAVLVRQRGSYAVSAATLITTLS